MATMMTMETHRVVSETRNLMIWASQTWPCGANSFQHLHQTILFHMKRSAQTLPALERDHNRLVGDNRKLQTENQELDDKLSTLDRAREKLQVEIKDGKKMIANHLRTVDSYGANNSRLKEELGKAREFQKLAPSRDDLVASVSRLEEELHTTRERLKFTVDCKRTVTDTNEELKKDLEGAQARETITNELNNLIYAQRKTFEVARYILEREKGVFETGMKYTKEREDEALRDLDVAKRDRDTNIAEVDRLNISNQELSRRLCEQGQSQLEAMRDLDINTAEVDRLNISNQDLSRTLCEQEQAQLEANTSRNAVEDRCRTLQDELTCATASLEDLKVKLDEADQACSQTDLELSILRKRLGEEVKTTRELTILMEDEKGESKARLEEEQTKSTESQTRHDRLTKELEDSDATVQRLESELSTWRKRLDDEVITTAELTSLMEEEKSESKTRLEEEQTKSTESKTRQDQLTKQLAESEATVQRLVSELKAALAQGTTFEKAKADSDATVQRLESGLEVALAQVAAFEKEKADLSADLDNSKSCEQRFEEELAEYARSTDLLHAESDRLSQKIKDLKEKEKTEDEKMTSLRGRVQELESALENSQHHAATSDRAKSALVGELDSAREREGAMDKALASHRDEMTALKTDHSKTTQQLEILRKELEDVETRANAPQSPSDGNLIDLNRIMAFDKTDEPTNDTMASCIRTQRQSKDQRRGSVDISSRNQSDAAEELTNEARTKPTPTALRPEEILHKQPPLSLPAVEKASAVTKSPTSPPLSQPLAKTGHKTTSTSKANEGVVRASIPSFEPDPMAAAVHGDIPDPTPLNKKHAREADCDEQAEVKMSKRARRRKRHRESLGVPE
jgi:chromosome segregation ATPase